MNIQQTRNAQNAIRAAIAICEEKGGLVNATKVANRAWIDAGEPYPLPVGEYRRYSWLMADLTRMQMQLAEQLRDLEFAAGYPVDEDTGCDLREWCGNDIQAAHEEALCMNEWFGYTEEQIAMHHRRVVYGLELRASLNADTVLEACHAEALDMDAWQGFTEEQRAIQNGRVNYGLNLLHVTGGNNVIDACHAYALIFDACRSPDAKIINIHSCIKGEWLQENMKVVIIRDKFGRATVKFYNRFTVNKVSAVPVSFSDEYSDIEIVNDDLILKHAYSRFGRDIFVPVNTRDFK